MKKTLTYSEVQHDIYDTYDHQFSWEASGALADYYMELEDETGEEIELDSVAICCDWGEYEDDEELVSEYKYLLDDAGDDEDETDEEMTPEEQLEEQVQCILDYLEGDTTVIRLSSGYLVMHF